MAAAQTDDHLPHRNPEDSHLLTNGTPKTPAHRTALVYDFDGTLAQGNIQEHSFIPGLGIAAKDFWSKVKAYAREYDADEILIYMWRMLELAKSSGTPLTAAALEAHGCAVPLFRGVESWFDRINLYAADRTLALEHYVISSGIHEMIRGCSIFGSFQQVYASRFVYDESGEAIWPAVAINYTNKTQFLFRINKGIPSTYDNELINRWVPLEERPVPFQRMIFIGDGETDIPSMKMVRHQGGHSVAVFDPGKWKDTRSQTNIYRLIAEDRVHFVAPADYSDGSLLDITVKGILGRIARSAGYRDPIGA